MGLLLTEGSARQGTTVFDTSILRSVALQDLSLAVLSACSTEKGVSLGSENLARAFLSDGVPHVVASRWNVDSASSAALMQMFYDRLLAGGTVPKSLASAEADLRLRDPHPYYWAGFDALGQN